MPKSIVELKIEERKLGRVTLQIPGQEDTLKLLEQKEFPSETTLLLILAQLDITLSSLRDALRGSGTKDFTTLETDAEAILSRLNTNLSTRASEATLSTRASQATLASVLTQLDVALSTRASEATLGTLATEATLATQLDITLSALRDAIVGGASPKNLKDLWDKLESILGQLDSKTSTLAKETGGNLATLAGKDFATQTTLAAQLDITQSALRDALEGPSDKNFTTLETDIEAILARMQGDTGSYGAVAVETTATQIQAADASRKEFLIYNNGAAIFYLGQNNSVTTANGIPIIPHRGASGRIYKGALWGIVSAGSVNTRWWRVT